MDNNLPDIRRRTITTMGKSVKLLGNVLKNVSQYEATTLRDGTDGWTIVEVICHLRDFDQFFYGRAVMMLEQDYPQLPAYDHEALARKRNYNGQNLSEVYTSLVSSRERFIEFFRALTPEQWERAGIHPERGHFTMTDAALQVCMHDVDHAEQITRILADRAATVSRYVLWQRLTDSLMATANRLMQGLPEP